MPSRKLVGLYGYLFLPHPKQFRKRPVTEEHKRVADYFRNRPSCVGGGDASDEVWDWVFPDQLADSAEQGNPIPFALLTHIRNQNYTHTKRFCVAYPSETDAGFYWLWWCFFHSRFCLQSIRYWLIFPLTMMLWFMFYFCTTRELFDVNGGLLRPNRRLEDNTGDNSNG